MAANAKALSEWTAQVVAAFVGNNTTPVSDLPQIIQHVHGALQRLERPNGAVAPSPAVVPSPAVPIRKSVHPDYIVCLEDGKRLKMLKRYLMSRYGMTPDAYRQRWGLPKDYPMVAPNYARSRADTARRHGLGRYRSINGGAQP